MLRRKPTGQPAVVGFAAESQNLVENARGKLQAKGLSLIVVNDITAPQAVFAADTNTVMLLAPSARAEAHSLMSKAGVAEVVLERVVELLSSEEG